MNSINQIGIARLRAEAADRERQEAARLQREREERIASEAAERARIEAEAKAERDLIAAVHAVLEQVADLAASEAAEKAKREANKAHKAQVNSAALDDIVNAMAPEHSGNAAEANRIAKAIVIAIASGAVRNVTIDRVTPSGRAVIGDQTYRKDGRQSGAGSSWALSSIEPITPENQKRLELRGRWRIAMAGLENALDAAEKVRRECSDHRSVPSPAVIAKAERIAAAIRAAMEVGDGE